MSDRTSQIIGRLSRINAYVVVVAFFLFITFIVGDSNLYKRYTYDEKIRSLEREIDLYDKEIEMNTIKLNDIRVNREGLERYAREEFFMKRPNEDVFIIED
ncbi:septum formation initiator [Tannerella sp. oral taxon 808]|nr:septum formation initiator [Tannerella sp. oral taxon 808]